MTGDATMTGREPAPLPATREACLARIRDLEDEVSAIRAQIAAADLDRQQRRGAVDARWFHRAKTALRHRRREIEVIQAHMSALRPPRDRFKDCLIEVLRMDYDDARWAAALAAARQMDAQRGAR